MIITQRIPIMQFRRLSHKIAKCVRECDVVYDMSILMKMGWRECQVRSEPRDGILQDGGVSGPGKMADEKDGREHRAR